MSSDGIVQKKISLEKKDEVRACEKLRDPTAPRMEVEALLEENARIKRSMAEELSRMGFAKETIERMLHVKLMPMSQSLIPMIRRPSKKILHGTLTFHHLITTHIHEDLIHRNNKKRTLLSWPNFPRCPSK